MSKRTTSTTNTRLFEWLFTLMLIAVPLVWSSEFVFVAYYPKLVAFHIGLAALYIAWLFKNRPIFHSSSLFLPIFAYLLIIICSALWAPNRIDTLVQVSHHLGLALLFFVLLNNIRTQNILRHMRPIVAIGIVIALIGIAQYAGWGTFWKIPSAGLPGSTLGYRNYAAMFTILCLPLSLLLFIEARHPKPQFGWGLGTAILFTFLICTRTRGAWAGLALGLLVVAIVLLLIKTHDGQRLWRALFSALTKDHLPPAILGVVITLLFLFLIPPNMQGRGFDRNRPDKAHIASSVASMLDRENDPQKSVQHRLNMWKNTYAMLQDTPLLGVGAGNWHIAYPPYDKGDIIWEGQTPRRPHNDFVWIAAELGVIGILIYAWLLLTIFFLIWRLLKTQNRSRVRQPLFIGMSLIALLGHALFSFPRERIAITLLFWTLITFIAIFDAESRPSMRQSFWARTRWLALAVVLLCVGMSVKAHRFDQHFARASKAIDRNDWNQVLRETSKAIDYGIFDPQAYLVRGVAHANLGNFSLALKDNAQTLKYHPNFLNALNNSGLYYNSLQQYQKAQDVLLQAIQIHAKHPDAYANLGISYQGLKQFDRSVEALKTAFELEPNNVAIRAYLGRAYNSQGDSYVRQGNSAKAIESFDNFLNIWQGDAQSRETVEQKRRALETP
ncbi:MAG: hypothetical protein HN521_04820 [Candidatus Latescibacteria bacterium]|jgi:O-antigen ligase/Flp pilus assembly protein TadD|nr:hypothetical protein [Candidatus Latescibacterota bacterium]